MSVLQRSENINKKLEILKMRNEDISLKENIGARIYVTKIKEKEKIEDDTSEDE